MTDWLELIEDVDAFNSAMDALDRLAKSVSLVGADLSGRDLSGRDSAASISPMRISRAVSSRVGGSRPVGLQGANLEGLTLDDGYWQATIDQIMALWAGGTHWDELRGAGPVILGEVDFEQASFGDIDLSDVTFPSGLLCRTRGFSRTPMDRTQFRATRLDGSSFDLIECSGLSLEDAVADGSEWTDAAIQRREVHRRGPCEKVGLQPRCVFDNVIFNDAQLMDCRFSACRFVSCLFYDADLSGAVFDARQRSNRRISTMQLSGPEP